MIGEIREMELNAVGRIEKGPTKTPDGIVHFILEASESFHCICVEKTAKNLIQHCKMGDEISIEGELTHIDFPNTGRTLVIVARHISYGRKNHTLRI